MNVSGGMVGKPWTEGRNSELRKGKAVKRLTQPRPHVVPTQTWLRMLATLYPFAPWPLPIFLGVLWSLEVLCYTSYPQFEGAA